MLAAEYEPYESSSIFLCVIDQKRLVPAGVSRAIVPSTAGFKSLHDIPRVWGADADDLIAAFGIRSRPATVPRHRDAGHRVRVPRRAAPRAW